MPDSKITALTSISTSTDPANDPLVIVDVSDTSMAATGTTKKVTLNQLLGASGTATLASATITGNLTVGTGSFGVGQSGGLIGNGNQLGFTNNSGSNSGWISNADNACIYSSGAGGTFAFNGHLVLQPRGSAAGAILFGTGNGAGAMSERYRIASDGVATWSNVGGVAGTAMTLNSTGLGVGVSPAYKLDVNGVARVNSGGDGVFISSASSPDLYVVGVNYYNNNGTEGVQVSARPSWKIEHKNSSDALAYLDIGFRAASAAASAFTSRFKIDGSGNVGIGVASPSAKLHVEGGGAQARFSIASASDARHEYYRNGIREGLITWDANVIGLYATQSSGEVVIASSNTLRVRVKAGGQVRFVPLASDPAGAEAGDVYYNSTSNKLKCYNGTTWNDLF